MKNSKLSKPLLEQVKCVGVFMRYIYIFVVSEATGSVVASAQSGAELKAEGKIVDVICK